MTVPATTIIKLMETLLEPVDNGPVPPPFVSPIEEAISRMNVPPKAAMKLLDTYGKVLFRVSDE